MKKLVAYFSASGVTRAAAQRLARAADADLFEIRPAVPYTSADLDWTNSRSRSSLEVKNPAARPELAALPESLASYDTVFLGFPIWWYTAPSILNSFVERCDLSGKTVIPFATSGGSGMGKTVSRLRALCPNAVWKEGRMLNHVSQEELFAWLNSIG